MKVARTVLRRGKLERAYLFQLETPVVLCCKRCTLIIEYFMVNPLFQNYANALSVPLDKYGRKTESQ